MRIKGERGTSTVELVIVLPTLLFLLFSIVELSRAWLTLNLATSAAREAARIGTVSAPEEFPNPPAAIQRITDFVGGAGGSGTVTCSPSPCAPDSTVEATVSVTFSTLVPVLLPMLDNINIQQTARMRYE